MEMKTKYFNILIIEHPNPMRLDSKRIIVKDNWLNRKLLKFITFKEEEETKRNNRFTAFKQWSEYSNKITMEETLKSNQAKVYKRLL